MREDRRYQIERTLTSLRAELETLDDLSQNLVVKVRASAETVERLRRMADELRRINEQGD